LTSSGCAELTLLVRSQTDDEYREASDRQDVRVDWGAPAPSTAAPICHRLSNGGSD